MLKYQNRKRKNKIGIFTPLERQKRLQGRVKSLRGFMLLEVVLSVFIVTVGIVFVIGSFITSIKTFKVSKVYLDTLYLMEERMWEYEGMGEGVSGEIEEGRDSGRFEGYKNAEWRVEAREIEEELPLHETNVEVVLKEDSKRRRFNVVTYFRIKE